MSLRTRRIIFFTLWVFVVLSGPLAILQNTSLDNINRTPINLINFLQRISGTLLFSLIFSQIAIGALMDKWTQWVGGKAHWFHITEGIAIFFLVLFHPLMELAITYEISKSMIDALAVIIPSLKNQREIYLTFGKASVVLLFLTIAAGFFRTKPIFRKHWLKFHYLNYLVFYLVYYHMRAGEDIMMPPFIYITWLALGIVTGILLLKFKNTIFQQKR